LLDNDPRRSPELLAAKLKNPARLKTDDRPRTDDRRLTTETVPVPLTPGWGGTHVFHRPVFKEDLVTSLLSDLQAALICHGLTVLDEETLQFFDDHGALASRLIEKMAAPAVGAFSSTLRVHANRVVIPGGDEAVALWEAVLLEKVTRPERFIE